jgi:hypothetical protein
MIKSSNAQIALPFAAIATGFAFFASDLATPAGLGHSVSPLIVTGVG